MSDDSQQQRADTMIDAALARLGATPMSEAFAEGLQARLDEERRRMARSRRNRRWLAAAAAVLLCAIVGQQTWREHTRHAQAAQMAKLAAQRQIALARRAATGRRTAFCAHEHGDRARTHATERQDRASRAAAASRLRAEPRASTRAAATLYRTDAVERIAGRRAHAGGGASQARERFCAKPRARPPDG